MIFQQMGDLKKIILAAKRRWGAYVRLHQGYCPICEADSIFMARNDWLRDHYRCTQCGSIPRQRALVMALNRFAPMWKVSCVHESSPGGVSSDFIARVCSKYSASQYFADIPSGEYSSIFKVQCQDLGRMSFADESFDLFITQDVFEHILEPQKAFAEIARVLKKGGKHIFTVPLYPELTQSRPRACLLENGKIEHLLEAQYHGNPVSEEGALVAQDWGFDIARHILEDSGMHSIIYTERNPYYGLDGEFLECVISCKE